MVANCMQVSTFLPETWLCSSTSTINDILNVHESWLFSNLISPKANGLVIKNGLYIRVYIIMYTVHNIATRPISCKLNTCSYILKFTTHPIYKTTYYLYILRTCMDIWPCMTTACISSNNDYVPTVWYKPLVTSCNPLLDHAACCLLLTESWLQFMVWLRLTKNQQTVKTVDSHHGHAGLKLKFYQRSFLHAYDYRLCSIYLLGY